MSYSQFTTLLNQAQKKDVFSELTSWVETKKFQDGDLPFLKMLQTPLQQDLILELMRHLALLRASFSESVKVLETGSELILMGHSEDLFEQTTTLEALTTHLRSLRYPATQNRDQDLKAKLETLPWPYGSKVKFERRGDRAGVELKLFISSQADLIKMISALERVKENLNS